MTMKKVLISVFILISSLALADNLTERYLQELKGIKFDNISSDMLKAAEDAYQSHLDKALPEMDRYFSGFGIEGDTMTFNADNTPRIITRKLTSSERLYVFMSSSVPEVVWKNYAQSVRGMKNAVIVLRGCIGGCDPEGYRKTVNFLRSLDNTSAIIDPMLFRLYGVSEVPAFIYADGVPSLDILFKHNPRKGTETAGDWDKLWIRNTF